WSSGLVVGFTGSIVQKPHDDVTYQWHYLYSPVNPGYPPYCYHEANQPTNQANYSIKNINAGSSNCTLTFRRDAIGKGMTCSNEVTVTVVAPPPPNQPPTCSVNGTNSVTYAFRDPDYYRNFPGTDDFKITGY